MGNLEHCANLFSNANNRVHNWHFFSQNITKGLWDNSRCKISGLELNQDSSISSGSAGEKLKHEGKNEQAKEFSKEFTLEPELVLHGTCTRTPWGFFRFTWELEDCWVARLEEWTWHHLFWQHQLVCLKICCCTRAGVLLAARGVSSSGDPERFSHSCWPLQSQLITLHCSPQITSAACCSIFYVVPKQAACTACIYIYIYKMSSPVLTGLNLRWDLFTPAASAVMQRLQGG